MPIPIHAPPSAAEKSFKAQGTRSSSPPLPFEISLLIEKAEQLLRQTGQSAQWQGLRDRDPANLAKAARLVLHRETLLQDITTEKSISWQEFDKITTDLQKLGLTLPLSRDIRRNNAAKTASPTVTSGQTADQLPPMGNPISEDNLLLLSATCPSIGLKKDLIGYNSAQTTFLPLGSLAGALHFNIKVHPQEQRASGWFIAEHRDFAIDFPSKTIHIAGKTIPWPEGRIIAAEDDFFVDSTLLSQWFPVDFKISTGEMSIEILPREQLPEQAQYEREKIRGRLLSHEDMAVKYPIQESEYTAYSTPIVDVAIQSGFETDHDRQMVFKTNHSLVAEGDFAHMGARVFLSGDEESPLDTARITLEKADRNATLLGPLKASKVSLGDVAPTPIPILGARSAERGVSLSNGDLQQSRDFDTTQFEGVAQTGWDVELYQNGNLIGSARVGNDGRYLFKDIPVYFGVNSFQVLGHGPQGQKRIIETKRINVGSGMLKKGDFEYAISATQQKQPLLELNEDNVNKKNQGAPRLNAKVAYGLTDHLTLTSGLSSIEFDDTLHTYSQVGLEGSAATIYGGANAISDSAGGSGYSLQALTTLGPLNLRAKHETFSNFIDEENPEKLLQERTTLGINGHIPELLFLPALSYTLSKESTDYTDLETEKYSARVSGRIQRLYLSNLLNWYDTTLSDTYTSETNGQFQASGSIGPLRLMAGVDYNLGERDEISRYRLGGLWPISKGMSASADVVHGTGENQRSSAQLTLNIDTGKYILTPSLSYNSEGDVGAFLGLSFSLGQDPASDEMTMTSKRRTGTGSATALVYHDANNNKVFDQDDTPLPEVRVIARQARKRIQTNENGLAQFTLLRTNEPTDIAIDPESLQDPSWTPSLPGIATVPRTGAVNQLHLPVVSSGEIDGTIYVQENNGAQRKLANAQLKLLNEQGQTIMEVASEYDGFYLFEKVLPGTYVLQVESTEPGIKEIAAKYRGKVTIDNKGNIVRGKDIFLQTSTEKEQEKVTNTSAPRSQAPQAHIALQPPQKSTDLHIAPLIVTTQLHPVTARAPETLPQPALEQDNATSQITTLDIKPLKLAASLNPLQPKHTANRDKAKNIGNTPVAANRDKSAHTFGSVVPKTAPNKATTDTQPTSNFTVHLASYRTPESAKAGIEVLKKRLSPLSGSIDLHINKVDLGPEKGIYFRVVFGEFNSKKQADAVSRELLMHTDYAQTIKSHREEHSTTEMNGNRLNARTGINLKIAAFKYEAMQRRV